MRRVGARLGVTLVEMVIALVLTLLVGSVAIGLLVQQQRFTRGVTGLLSVRDQLDEAAQILTSDLRTVAISGTPLYIGSDTAVEFFSTIGASSICSRLSDTQIAIPPDTLASGIPFSAWTAQPDSDDDVLVFHDTSALSPAAGWVHAKITRMTSSTASAVCPPASGFTTNADLRTTSYVVTLDAPLPVAIISGSPIRFLRLVRYSIYRSSDNSWYLGYRRCSTTANSCTTIQPLSGPYTSERTPPLALHYYSATGAEIFSPVASSPVARVDITVHGKSQTLISIPGLPSSQYSDSALTTIAFRNHQ